MAKKSDAEAATKQGTTAAKKATASKNGGAQATVGKKPAAKKAPAAKNAATGKPTAGSKSRAAKPRADDKRSPSTASQETIARIVALLEQMDEAGLEFIHSQAEIIVTTEKLGKAREKTTKALDTVSKQRAVVAESAPPQPAVGIEQKQDNAFFIRTYGKKIFFNRNEMRGIAATCHAASNASDGARRIYAWMKRERSDYLIDAGITGPGDFALKMLWEQVVSTYAPPR